jgi:hypothetical protein
MNSEEHSIAVCLYETDETDVGIKINISPSVTQISIDLIETQSVHCLKRL